MNYLTCKQMAEVWACTPRRVQDLCKKGAIVGAVRHGREWLIPPNTPKPADGRKADSPPPACHTIADFMDPFLSYTRPGQLQDLLDRLDDSPAHDLFRAQIHAYRGEIEQALSLLLAHKQDHLALSLRGVLSTTLCLCAIATGNTKLWQDTAQYLSRTPRADVKNRALLDFWQAANISMISDYSHFSPAFRRGDFSELPAKIYPIARFYYAQYLYLQAHQTPVESISGRVTMFFMYLLPLTMEPLICQTHIEGAMITELHLRLLCAVTYHTSGQDALAIDQIKRALDLALPDRLYLPVAEYYQSLAPLMDDLILNRAPDALAPIKRLSKAYHQGWILIHNDVLNRTVSSSLSHRERQIASLAVYGLSNKEIADRLGITVDAVKQTLRSTMNKTGAQNRKELYRFI